MLSTMIVRPAGSMSLSRTATLPTVSSAISRVSGLAMGARSSCPGEGGLDDVGACVASVVGAVVGGMLAVPGFALFTGVWLGTGVGESGALVEGPDVVVLDGSISVGVAVGVAGGVDVAVCSSVAVGVAVGAFGFKMRTEPSMALTATS